MVVFCIEEVPYCFSRSSVKFQGHTGQKKITDFDPISLSYMLFLLYPAYADDAALLAGFVDPTFDKTMWGGLVFTNSFPDPTAIPSDIRYSLRPRSEEYAESFGSSTPWDWFTELMYPEFQQPGPRAAYDDKGGPPGKIRMRKLWHGNGLSNAGPLWRESPGHRWISFTEGQ